MARAFTLYCTNGDKCKNITERGNSTPTVLRNARTICSYCLKTEPGFSSLRTEPQMVLKNGPEKRGRPSLKLDEKTKKERVLAQRAIAQLKQRRKKRLIEELGSEQHPEWDARWKQIEDAIELSKSQKWGKEVFVTPAKTQAQPKNFLSKGKTTNFEWYVYPTANGLHELRIHKIDKLTKARSDAFVVKNLTTAAYESAIKKLETRGLDSLQPSFPISAYTTKARDFRNKFLKSQLTKTDIDQLKNQMTFGFLFALHLLEKPNVEKTYIKSVYGVLGDEKIPSDAGPLQVCLKNWTQALCDMSKQSPSDENIKTITYLKKHLALFAGIFKTVEDYQSVLPWVANSTRIIEKYRNQFAKDSIQKGRTAHGGSFRCLRLSEITAIFNECPTITHAALAALGLSTGLRPEEIRKLSPDHWDRESGKIFFDDGKLLSAKLAAHDPKYLANPNTSAVVRLILMNKEFLDLSIKEKALDWFSASPLNSVNVMKSSDTLQRIVSYTKTRVATLRDFRTTCATMLAFCGVERHTIKERCGHKSELTTEEFYIKSLPPDAGAFADIEDRIKRGYDYLRQPEVVFPDETNYHDTNYWDTFILVQFLNKVLDLKRNDYHDNDVNEAQDQVLKYWEYELVPKLKKAINMSDIARQKRFERLPIQKFDPRRGLTVRAETKNLPFKKPPTETTDETLAAQEPTNAE